MSKIGIGIVTCDRPDYLKKLVKSLQGIDFAEICIINDGARRIESTNKYKIHNNIPPKQGVGKAKNLAIKYLSNCDYIFLLEDDIVIKDKSVFQKYIDASNVSGIQHLNFAFHGTDNYKPDGSPAVRLKIEYTPDIAISLYPNLYGAFSFYTKQCLDKVGPMDEFYYNALEHVCHTQQVIKEGMHPPFRWFADLADSNKYIEEIDRAHAGSEIRRDKKWIENFHKSANYFVQKNGFDVRDPYAKTASREETLNFLKQLKNAKK
jgi:glycosyltransferase involved in cell wall biosynthesis